MHCTILHLRYVTQAESVREQLSDCPKKCFACSWSLLPYAVFPHGHHHQLTDDSCKSGRLIQIFSNMIECRC